MNPPNCSPKLKVALLHDWLNGMRGGEKCLEALCELFPQSSIFTLFYEKGKPSQAIARHPIVTSFLQKFPNIFRNYRTYLPFFPKAVESFDLRGYDWVISTSHCVAKGAVKEEGSLHVSYCFTPMRYAWGFFDEYFGDKSPFSQRMIQFFLKRLRRWDLKTSNRVDHFVAISQHIKNRIAETYHRHADVIYPPVDTEFYTPNSQAQKEDFYLVVSALVPYKKIDLAVHAFNESGKKLLVIGDGPNKQSLQKIAKTNIRFLGWQSDEALRENYRKAKALIFPGEEDFGIVPLEMQACGGCVIALRKGGATETVVDGKTGLFFDEPTVESLNRTVEKFEQISLSAQHARENALRVGRERFKKEILAMIEKVAAAKGGCVA